MQTVTVTTIKKLSPEQLKSIKDLVEPKVGKIKIEEVIDQNIIGGVQITIGNQTFDASISGRLEKIQLVSDKIIVTSAIPLTTEQKKKISTAVEKKYGISEIEEVIDPSVIGGLKIRVGSREIDHTLQHKLATLKQQLLENI